MKRGAVSCWCAVLLLLLFTGYAVVDVWAGEPAGRAPIDRAKTPGRQVRVAAIAIGSGGEPAAKLKLALSHLETAGRQGVDIACLPEIFTGGKPEPISGPTTQAVAELARKHRMWVVCPIREQAGERQYNTAVLINRAGEVAGRYRKVFVFWGEGLNLGEDGVGVFETDFGRIALLTCFDANYDELWREAAQKGAEMVLWPSAYGGGAPLNGYAMIHNYPIVPVGWGNIIDAFGREVETEKPREKQFIATLDLDQTIVHKDFNGQKVARLLAEHKGEVEAVEPALGDKSGWYVLRALKPGVRVRELCRQYQIETLRAYRERSRQEINARRKKGERV